MRFRPVNLKSVAIAGVILAAFPAWLCAQSQTETKIRLMSDALAARDHGDLAAAKGKLEALQAIAPNDPNVRRILAEVTARLENPPAAPVAPLPAPGIQPPPESAPVAPAPAGPAVLTAVSTPTERPPAQSAAGRVLMPTVHEEKPDGPVGPEAGPAPKASPEAMAAAAAAEALLHADDDRLGTLVAYVQAQRALARTQAREKNYAAAIATLDSALEELEKPASDLRAERAEYVRKAKEAAAAEAGVKLRHHR
jgi:general secretion pathway protein D